MRHHDIVNPYNVAVSRLISDVVVTAKPWTDFLTSDINSRIYSKSLFKLMGMMSEACLPSNAYSSGTPDDTSFILGPCLFVWTFLILSLYILTVWFSEIRIWYVDLRLNVTINIYEPARRSSYRTHVSPARVRRPIWVFAGRTYHLVVNDVWYRDDLQEESSSCFTFLIWGLFTVSHRLFALGFSVIGKQKGREKSRECHNHKPQPFPDTKRKRKPTKPNKPKSNKRKKSTKISSLFPTRGNRNAKRTEKHNVKIKQGKT